VPNWLLERRLPYILNDALFGDATPLSNLRDDISVVGRDEEVFEIRFPSTLLLSILLDWSNERDSPET
jgi:hypothetical protein